MMSPISVCVIACNEEAELPRCLDSVGFADELIIVVDSKSTDATHTIARARADRVEVRPYVGDIEQKSHCVELASHDWVLIVDPDEVVPADLARELQGAVRNAGREVGGIEINRLTYHLGRWIRHGDFHPDWTLRAFRRSRAKFAGHNPHGRIEVEGSVIRVATPLEHYSYRDLADQIDRIQRFSDAAAGALELQGRPVRVWDMVVRPPARFLRAYLLRRGFLDGVPGLVIAAATGFNVFLKYAKLWERRQRSDGSVPRRSRAP